MPFRAILNGISNGIGDYGRQLVGVKLMSGSGKMAIQLKEKMKNFIRVISLTARTFSSEPISRPL